MAERKPYDWRDFLRDVMPQTADVLGIPRRTVVNADKDRRLTGKARRKARRKR